MADSPRSPGSADRNLLFGILAVQLDFVSQAALLKAMNAWVLDKAKTLGDILREQGAISAENQSLLNALVQNHVQMHEQDVQKSLAALGTTVSVRAELEQIADADVRAAAATLVPPAADRQWTESSSTPASRAPAESRYLSQHLHARGGLGEVFLALDQELHREVALKEIQGPYAHDPDKRARFVREAEITGGLEHPGIVPVYGLGAYADGRPYYAMRFIKGESLQHAIEEFHRADAPGRDPSERNRSFRALLRRLIDTCNPIAYAHDRRILHRDLKPSNIMLGKYGETLVVDWGLAKSMGSRGGDHSSEDHTLLPSPATSSVATQMGSAMGTPAYMSPEQAAGRLGELGPSTDVYSLGATLYCLLTGKPPFTDPNVQVALMQVQLGEFPPPRQVKPGTPPALEAICLHAMALEPAKRYGTARDLADDLERWLADEPVTAWPDPWSTRARRWLGRHRTLVTAAAVAAVVTVAGLSVGLILLAAAAERESFAKNQETAAREDAQSKQILAVQKEREAQQHLDEALNNLYFSHMHLALEGWNETEANVGWARSLLEEHIPGGQRGAVDRRGFEWHYLWRLCHADILTCTGHKGNVAGVCFSPDGGRLASASADRTVKIWDAWSGQEIRSLTGHTDDVTGVAYSPDGQRLASSSWDNTVCIWDAKNGRQIHCLTGHTNHVHGVAFSPDGKSVASASQDLSVRLWNAETGALRMMCPQPSPVLAVCFSPDSRSIAGSLQDSSVRIWSAETGLEIGKLSHPVPVRSVSFSPDGASLATAAEDWTIRVWNLATRQVTWSKKGHSNWAFAVRYSPDGQRLASASHDQTVVLWDAGTGAKIQTFKGHSSIVYGVDFSPDGERLASAGLDQTIRVWDVKSNPEARTFLGHTEWVTGVAFSPDGQRVASASNDRTVRLWDPATGHLERTLRGHSNAVLAVSFSTNGRQLATGSKDRSIKIWDATTGKLVRTLSGHSNWINGVCFSKDGANLASASGDRSVKVWDLATGLASHTLTGPDRARAVAFSQDGQCLAAVFNSGSVKIWGTSNWQEMRTLPSKGDRGTAVCFSPDSKRLASTTDRTVRVWDVATGAEVFTFPVHANEVTGLSFSADGQRLASGSFDQTIKIWDMKSGQEALSLRGGQGAILAICFSADGQRLLSGSQDNTIRLWDARPLTPEMRAERLALTVLRGILTKPPGVDIAAVLAAKYTLPPLVRERTLALFERHQATYYTTLSEELSGKRQFDEATAALRLAIEEDPIQANAHQKLAQALVRQGRLDDADAEYRKAIELEPTARAYYQSRANLFLRRNRFEDMKAVYREAIKRLPNDARAHTMFANALKNVGLVEEAEAEYRRAIALSAQAQEPVTYISYGEVLFLLGRLDEAKAEMRKGIAASPNSPVVHHYLGLLSRRQGLLQEALAEFQQATGLRSITVTRDIEQVQLELALQPRLAAVLRGEDRPKTPEEFIGFAQLCQEGTPRHYAAAVGFYAAAFGARPALAGPANRYPAACAAALAGSGRDDDMPPLGRSEQARLRAQARAWLSAELASRAKEARPDSPQILLVLQHLHRWRRDPDLAGVRDAASLAQLPEAERVLWQKFWKEVDSVLETANDQAR